jgi:uncharacterized protein YpbB
MPALRRKRSDFSKRAGLCKKEIRKRKLSSVIALVAEKIASDEVNLQPQWLAPEVFDEVVAAYHQLGTDRLKPLKDILRPEITYEQIRLVTAHLRAKANTIRA